MILVRAEVEKSLKSVVEDEDRDFFILLYFASFL